MYGALQTQIHLIIETEAVSAGITPKMWRTVSCQNNGKTIRNFKHCFLKGFLYFGLHIIVRLKSCLVSLI